MILRQARLSDAPDICAIINAVIRDTTFTFTTKERTEAGMAADMALSWSGFQVAEQDGKVIGYATFAPFRTGPGYAHTKEVTIHLAAQARRQGTGRALMQRLEEVAIRQNVHVLVGGISASNPDGIAFHAACGFQEVGRLSQVGFKSGQWLDLILMQKTLTVAIPDADSAGVIG